MLVWFRLTLFMNLALSMTVGILAWRLVLAKSDRLTKSEELTTNQNLIDTIQNLRIQNDKLTNKNIEMEEKNGRRLLSKDIEDEQRKREKVEAQNLKKSYDNMCELLSKMKMFRERQDQSCEQKVQELYEFDQRVKAESITYPSAKDDDKEEGIVDFIRRELSQITRAAPRAKQITSKHHARQRGPRMKSSNVRKSTIQDSMSHILLRR